MKINDLILAMIDFYQGHPKQIQHLIKVHSFARVIGIDEGLSTQEQERLEVAAIVHDIGIKPAWEKYNSSNGKYQEELGPAEAIKLLNRLNYDEALIERVAYLVGHHHTYSEIDGLDYQILVEADFLVIFLKAKVKKWRLTVLIKKSLKQIWEKEFVGQCL